MCPSTSFMNITSTFNNYNQITDKMVQDYMNQVALDSGPFRGYLSKNFDRDQPYSDVYTTYLLIGKP